MNTITEEQKPQSLWGYGIAITYVAFMAMILTIVFKSTSEKMELVSDDYYKEGVDYQKVIDSRRHTAALTVKPKFYQSRMEFVIPAELKAEFQNAQIKIFRPSEASLDQTITATPDENGTVKLPELKKGAWQIYLIWEDQKKQEFQMQWNIFK